MTIKGVLSFIGEILNKVHLGVLEKLRIFLRDLDIAGSNGIYHSYSVYRTEKSISQAQYSYKIPIFSKTP